MKFKVNEKNYASIMDKVNRFLSKPTVEDLGIQTVVVGYEKVAIHDVMYEGRTIKVPQYETKRVFKPFLNGSCYVHPMWREKRSIFDKNYKRPILAISSKLHSSCIPLQEGSTVEITSTKMVVVSIDTNLNLTPMVHTFFNKTLSEEEMRTETLNSLKSCYLDYYLGALSMELEYGEYSFEEREVYRALVDMFIKYVEEAIDNATDGIAKFDITKDILNEEMEEYYMITELKNTIHCTIDFRDFAKTGTYVDTYQVGESSSNVKEDMLLICDECMMLFFDER